MLKKSFIWLIITSGLMLCWFYSGCGKKAKKENAVARINNYVMTIEDLEDEIRHSPYTHGKTPSVEELLDLAIRRQVLIQEAQRQGLDRRKSFMKTIERYWRQTLIKELLEKETLKIHETVSKNKQDQALDDWMEGLYKKADIKIDEEVLKEFKNKRKLR